MGVLSDKDSIGGEKKKRGGNTKAYLMNYSYSLTSHTEFTLSRNS